MIDAKIIKDSISDQKHRLTTFKLKYPRFIHSEFMTHRTISRNASSSRAIPFDKQVKQVQDKLTRATPVFWGIEQKGMQTTTELSREPWIKDGISSPLTDAMLAWDGAAQMATGYAQNLAAIGTHKSICNRVIEPYTHITVIASATENGWLNFFGLRLDKAAEPTMRALAIEMFDEYCDSRPVLLQSGWWHLPFWEPEDSENLLSHPSRGIDHQIPIKISVARCARVSYESFDTGKRSTIDEDLKLYDKLVGSQPLHASPAEHQATPDVLWKHLEGNLNINGENKISHTEWTCPTQHGNFLGWRQYRKTLTGEAIAPLPEEFASRLPQF